MLTLFYEGVRREGKTRLRRFEVEVSRSVQRIGWVARGGKRAKFF